MTTPVSVSVTSMTYDQTPEQEAYAALANHEAAIIRAEIIRATGKPYQEA